MRGASNIVRPWYMGKTPIKPIVAQRKRHDCCILVCHHKNDTLTNKHIGILKEKNSCPVIPIFFDGKGVEGAVNVLTPEWKTEDKWAGFDMANVCWFQKRPFDADRYILLEYDALATMPVHQFYKDVWNADYVGINVLEYGKHKWSWWKHYDRLPPDLKHFAVGSPPLCGTMLSHACMSAIADRQKPHHIISELRLPTLARASGFQITRHPFGSKTISYNAKIITVNRDIPGIYHPVKS